MTDTDLTKLERHIRARYSRITATRKQTADGPTLHISVDDNGGVLLDPKRVWDTKAFDYSFEKFRDHR